MSVIVPPNMIAEMEEEDRDFCLRIRGKDSKDIVAQALQRNEYPMPVLENMLGDRLKTAKILEIGSGRGLFLCHALQSGLDIVGIEPGTGDGFVGRRDWALRMMKANGIERPEDKLLDAVAEKLPFPDDSFDMVISVAVLEHVSDVKATMTEAMRVLKRGGVFWANVPNYHSTHEGHYDLFWFPSMPKSIAKRYVKMFGRDPSFINSLNFTTPDTFAKYKKYGKLSWYPYGTRFNSVFTAFNYCCNSKLIPAESCHNGLTGLVEKTLRSKAGRATMIVPLMWCVIPLYFLGQSTVFDLAIVKK